MSKLILLAVIAVIIVALLGLYFIFISSNMDNSVIEPQSTSEPSTVMRNFDMQGVRVEVQKEGTGVEVKSGDNITVHYVGTLADGTKFDSSVDKKRPYSFTVGNQSVAKGFDIAVVGMKVGEKRKLTIPPELGYGKEGFITIPPNATLTFEIELLKIN